MQVSSLFSNCCIYYTKSIIFGSFVECSMEEYQHGITGIVIKFVENNVGKAILVFEEPFKDGHVLLFAKNLYINQVNLQPDSNIQNHLTVGEKLRFSCRSCTKGPDNCEWFALSAYKLEEGEGILLERGLKHLPVSRGITNRKGKVTTLHKTQAMLTFTDESGVKSYVEVNASEIYIYGVKFDAKMHLTDVLKMFDSMYFDAIPYNDEAGGECTWRAVLAWTSTYPYDTPSCIVTPRLVTQFTVKDYEQELVNPENLFYRGEGEVIEVITTEFGVCLTQIKSNLWHTVLFHRSAVTLCGTKLDSHDLAEVFTKGDPVKFIAIPTATASVTQWVACQLLVASPSHKSSSLS